MKPLFSIKREKNTHFACFYSYMRCKMIAFACFSYPKFKKTILGMTGILAVM